MTVRNEEKIKPNVPDDPFALYDKKLKAKAEKSLTKNGIATPFEANAEMEEEENNNPDPLRPKNAEEDSNHRRDS